MINEQNSIDSRVMFKIKREFYKGRYKAIVLYKGQRFKVTLPSFYTSREVIKFLFITAKMYDNINIIRKNNSKKRVAIQNQ